MEEIKHVNTEKEVSIRRWIKINIWFWNFQTNILTQGSEEKTILNLILHKGKFCDGEHVELVIPEKNEFDDRVESKTLPFFRIFGSPTFWNKEQNDCVFKENSSTALEPSIATSMEHSKHVSTEKNFQPQLESKLTKHSGFFGLPSKDQSESFCYQILL